MGTHMSEVTSELTKARVEVLDAQAEANFARQEAEGAKLQLARTQHAASKQVTIAVLLVKCCMAI